LKGRTKDPWAPVKADGSTSHTPTGAGFGYRQMANLLDREKITAPLLAQLREDDDRKRLAFVASALVRGQGKTDGLHRRTIRTTRIEQVDDFDPVTILDMVGHVAKGRSGDAYEASRRLRRSLMLLMQGGPDQARLDDDSSGRKVDPWIRRFDRMVDRIFFDAFWQETVAPETDEATHRLKWRERLRALAGIVCGEAAKAAPRTEMRRIRAIARARSMLDGQMAKWLKEIVV